MGLSSHAFEQLVSQLTVGQLVNTSVNTLNNPIQGEHCAKSRPSQMFHSVRLSLDACIPEKVKTKITCNEYNNFGLQITNHIQQNNKYQLSIINGVGDQPSLSLEPSNKTKRIINIESWMSAFRIFVVLYTQRYPKEAPALMKYSDLIQDLASRGHDSKYNYENFRFMRQGQPDAYPWELWLHLQVSMKASQPTSHSSLSKAVKSPAIPKGYCYRFQREGVFGL